MENKPLIRVGEIVRPASGGIRKHISILVSHLDAHEFAPTLYAPPDFQLDGEAVGVPRMDIALSARTKPAHDWQSIRQLALLLQGNIDLVHAHGLRGAWIGVLAASRAGIPSLFTAHNLAPRMGLPARLSLRLLCRKAAAVIAVSQAVADSLIRRGANPSKIIVIPNGIALEAWVQPACSSEIRAQYAIPTNAPFLAAVGRLAPEKGFDLLLAALPEIIHCFPDVRLVLAGSGPEEARLQTLAGSLPVTLTGRIEHVLPLFQAADVVVIPSRAEGQGIVALEAMAAGKPVVASRVGGLVETVVEGQTGYLAQGNDPHDLALGVIRLLSDPTLRSQFGAAGRSRVEQLYTADSMINSLEILYKKYAKPKFPL